MRNGVFISYRRDDTKDMAHELHSVLGRNLPGVPSFIGVEEIKVGEVWQHRLAEALDQCAVLLAVVGANWESMRGNDGRRRLDDPDDPVRRETLSPVWLQAPNLEG